MRRLLVLCCAVLWMMFFLFVSGERLQDIERTPLTVEAPGVFPLDSPPCFIPNMGQVPQRVKFHTRTPFHTLWLTNEGLIIRNTKKNNTIIPPDEVRLVFPGAEKSPVLLPAEIPRRHTHIKENPLAKVKRGNGMSRAVCYKDIYNAIDLVVYVVGRQVNCDWVIKPGGNPRDIRFEYLDVKHTKLDMAGNLIIETVFGKLIHRKLHGYQERGGSSVGRHPAESFHVEVEFKKISGNTYTLDVGVYHKDQELIISPILE